VCIHYNENVHEDINNTKKEIANHLLFTPTTKKTRESSTSDKKRTTAKPPAQIDVHKTHS